MEIEIIKEKIKCQREFFEKMSAEYGPSSLQALLANERLDGMENIGEILVGGF